jgi:hypothetical protein
MQLKGIETVDQAAALRRTHRLSRIRRGLKAKDLHLV